MTRNVSETQLLNLRTVGTKALSNVTQQFNKLNKLGHSFNTRGPKQAEDDNEKDKVTLCFIGKAIYYCVLICNYIYLHNS